MGDKSKTKKIVLSSLLVGIPAIAGITIGIIALTKNRKETTQPVQSVQIVNDVGPIDIEQGNETTTEPVVVKCFDKNQKEVSASTKLQLLNSSKQLADFSWISIDSKNRIVISKDAPSGDYLFYLQASSIDGKIVSEHKQLNVKIISKPSPSEPNKLIIEGLKNFSIYKGTTKEIEIVCKAFLDEKELQEFGDVEWSVSIADATSSQMTPPLLQKQINKNIVNLKIITDDTHGPIGSYTLQCNVKLLSNPEINATSTCNIQVTDGIYFEDSNGYVYKRESINDQWTLYEVPKETKIIEEVREEIDGYPVVSVATNLAYRSSLTNTLTKVVLPSSITTIEKNAFHYCVYLTTVTMPGVKTVKENGFYSCQSMQIAEPYPILESVGGSAFYYCNKIPSNLDLKQVTEIGSYAFYKCSFKSIELSENLTKIQASAFAYIATLETVKVNAVIPPQSEGLLFSECNALTSIFVPSSSVEQYKSANYWNYHAKIIYPIT